MLLTKKLIRLKNDYMIEIPRQMKGLWDLSENRWGYKKVKK